MTLAYLTPDMTSAQRELFCLVYDDETSELLGIQRSKTQTPKLPYALAELLRAREQL